jgi:acetoin utilization deacetylase AcuC-like enzyme
VPKSASDDILTEILEKFHPIIKDFSPDTIAVSAGFDGYMNDALLDLNYSKHGFYSAGKIISSLDIPTFALLEGGYHNEVVDCIQCFTSGMNNSEYPADEEPTESNEKLYERFREYLQKSRIL